MSARKGNVIVGTQIPTRLRAALLTEARQRGISLSAVLEDIIMTRPDRSAAAEPSHRLAIASGKVTSKNRLTLPVPVCERLCAHVGQLVNFHPIGDHSVEIRPV